MSIYVGVNELSGLTPPENRDWNINIIVFAFSLILIVSLSHMLFPSLPPSPLHTPSLSFNLILLSSVMIYSEIVCSTLFKWDIQISFSQMNLSDVSTINMVSICWTHFIISLIIMDDRGVWQSVSRSRYSSGWLEVDEILYLIDSLKPGIMLEKSVKTDMK